MARSVKPSTGRLAKQFPRSRRSLTHSRGGKRSSSLLGGVQSWYTACRTSSSKDRTSFSSASESPYLWGGSQGNTSGSPAFGRCRQTQREGETRSAAQCPTCHQRVYPEDQHLDSAHAQQEPTPSSSCTRHGRPFLLHTCSYRTTNNSFPNLRQLRQHREGERR